MKISIRLMLADVPSSTSASEIDVPDGSTVEHALKTYLDANHVPDPYNKIHDSMLMVSKTPATPETILKDGDELMVMRILGGG